MSASLQEVGVAVRALLNEQGSTGGMWSNQDLKIYIRMAFEGFHRMAVRKNPEFGAASFSFTYTGGARGHEVPLTELDPASITAVGDQTEGSEPLLIDWAGSQTEIMEIQASGSLRLSRQKIFVARVGDNLLFQIGPIPATNRTIWIYFQQTPSNFISHLSMRTGLPDPYDKAIVFEVARLARVQEQNTEMVRVCEGLLRDAKIDIARYIRSLKRGSKRVRFDPEDYQ